MVCTFPRAPEREGVQKHDGSDTGCPASFPDKKHKSFIKDFIKYTHSINLNFHIMNKQYWEKLSADMGTIPTVGCSAIFDLLQYNIKEIYVVGFTFCQIKDKNGFYYYPEYFYDNSKHLVRKGGKKHDNDKIFRYFKQKCQQDNRIRCDEVLERLIK